jgi:putative membrane protein
MEVDMKHLVSQATAAVSTLALISRAAMAQGGPGDDRYWHGPHMMWGDGGWSMFFFGPLFMILVLAGTVAAIVFLLRGFGYHATNGGQPASRSLEILKERYARGEIDKTEFEERRKVIGA